MPKLDSFLNLLLPQPEVFDSNEFSPDDSIIATRKHVGTDDTLVVIVPPWHANTFL